LGKGITTSPSPERAAKVTGTVKECRNYQGSSPGGA